MADSPGFINVIVKGQVGTPGPVRLISEERWPLLRALVKADGLNDSAAPGRIRVERNSQVFTVDRYSEMHLQEGDVVTVDTLRGILVKSLENPKEIEFTQRQLAALVGPGYPEFRGMVVHYSPTYKSYSWDQARFFDGRVYRAIDLEDDDLIVLSKLDSTKPVEISIAGEVRNPGPRSVQAGSSVLDALVAANGFTPNADIGKVLLVRENKEFPVTDLLRLSTTRIFPNDTIRIDPLSQIHVGVIGDVQHTGDYLVSLDSSDPLSDALQAAGGGTEPDGLYRFALTRPGQDWLDPEREKVVLQNGDCLWVDQQRCTIAGAVDHFGYVNLKKTDNLLTLVRASGARRGQLDKVMVRRAADSKRRWETYDLTQTESAAKISIADGDLIYVLSPGENPSAPYIDNLLQFYDRTPVPFFR